jgi:hypothetical protein
MVAEGAEKLKYGTEENICSHTSMGAKHGWYGMGGG